MKLYNIRKFVEVFKNLDPQDKLIIADAIVEELHLSDKLLEQDGYNRDLSGMIMPILEDYVSKEKNKEKLKHTNELLDRFNKLPANNQTNIIESLEESFENKLTQEELFYKYQLCQKEGHIFDDINKSKKGKPYIKRKCLRCGMVETKQNN